MLDGYGVDAYLGGSSLSFERLIGGYLRKLRVVRAFAALQDIARAICRPTRHGSSQRALHALFEESGSFKCG